MIRNALFTAGPHHAGERLDRFLVRAIPLTTRALVERAMERGGILCNGRPARKGRKIAPGDRVSVLELLEQADWRAAPDPSLPLRVLHEEEAFLALDKPAGRPVHPLEPDETGTMVNALLAAYPETAAVGPDRLFPSIVHRLDTDTSGVLLAARDEAAYSNLRAQFHQHRVEKRYVALVAGRLEQGGRLEHRLAHAPGPEHRMIVEEPGRGGRRPMRAVTEYAPRRWFPDATLLDIVIRTGVTHQIRCQLAALGHPILGDALYGGGSGHAGRLFLHAARIRFLHPRTGAPCEFGAPMPDDLAAALDRKR